MKLSLTKDLRSRKAALEDRLKALVASGPMDAVYAMKAAMARDYLEAGDLSLLLHEEAAAKGMTELDLARDIRARHLVAQQALAASERARQRLQERVRAATGEQELDAVETELQALLAART